MVTITIKFDEISQNVHSCGYPTIEVNVITADGVLHRADILSGASTEPFEGREGLMEETITIKSIKASPVIDDIFGIPIVEVDVITSDGLLSRATVPSHASTGLYEASELRDGELDYLTKGVLKAVENVNAIIAPALIGKDPTNQVQIDNLMVQQLDRTSSEWGWCKQKLDANAILAVSLAICKAGAAVNNIPLYKHIANLSGNKTLVLPVPAFNVINGRLHAENKLAMQKFMILPTGANSFKEAILMGVKVYRNLKDVIKENYGRYATNVDVEGLFALNIQENKEGIELLKRAIAKAGYTGKFIIEMGDIVEEIGEQVQIVGDDLFGTNHAVNQVRSVTEGIEATKMSKSVGWALMVSLWSGEIEDAFIVDLSVGLATGLIKTGPPIHPESVGKYNQLRRIEEELGSAAIYAGANFKAPLEHFLKRL